jgi:hypothetical protein
MALLTAGYWPTTYWADSYFADDYWQEVSTSPSNINKVNSILFNLINDINSALFSDISKINGIIK